MVMVEGLTGVAGPRPGWVLTFLGLGLIAGEFLPVARFMDRGEVKLRAAARWLASTWTSSSSIAKVSVCLAILLCIAALGYGAYYLFFGGSNFLTALQ